MAQKKENGDKDKRLQTLILITVILELANAIMAVIAKLLEQGKGLKPLPIPEYSFSGPLSSMEIVFDLVRVALCVALIGYLIKHWND